jgi:hypothetical protein
VIGVFSQCWNIVIGSSDVNSSAVTGGLRCTHKKQHKGVTTVFVVGLINRGGGRR